LRGNLALHGAADGGHLDTLRLLLPRTRQPDLKNLEGKSAQDLARERGHEEAARLF
jgi:ankyrin repeat protein